MKKLMIVLSSVSLVLLTAVPSLAQDSSHVRLLGSYDTPGFARGVAVVGNYAYVADGGVRVINITNPVAPSEVGFCGTPGGALGVAVSGNYAYVAAWGGLRVVKIANPAAPTEVGFYDMAGRVYDVAVSGNYAYVADDHAGLRVVDVTNPAAPTEVGFYGTPGRAWGVAVSGCRAYVADSAYFGVYDVSYFSPCPVPCVPGSVIIQYLPETQDFLLHWAPVLQDTAGLPIEVDYYVVQRGNSTDAMDSLGVPVPLDTTVFIDSTAFDAGAKFFYQVKAVKN
ncbi:MAG: hypothetical protein NT025_01260 [bacterium]|nr:hypothetical protein [bacterium]